MTGSLAATAVAGVLAALCVRLWADARSVWHRVASVELALTVVLVLIGAWLP